MIFHKNDRGFTLIELLVVIAIIGILVTIVFAVLDPLKRFGQSRDAVRQNDVQEILTAVKLYQLDNSGEYITAMQTLDDDEVYMLVNGGGKSTGCTVHNDACDTDVSADANCLNVAQLITAGYLADMPVSPSGAVAWDEGEFGSDDGSGYTLMLDDDADVVTIRSCESEQNAEISAAR